MALYKSQLVTAVSGSVGGLNFAHCRAGSYFRAKPNQRCRSTERQAFVRAITRDVLHRWSSVLTDGQRHAWTLYARNVPLPGPLGDLRHVDGRNMFLRANVGRALADLKRATEAPAIFTVASLGPARHISAKAVSDGVRFDFDDSGPWTSDLNSAILVYVAPPQNPTVNFYARTFRYQTKVQGHPLLPPNSPKSFVYSYPLSLGQRIFYRLVFTGGDSRFSAPTLLTGLVT